MSSLLDEPWIYPMEAEMEQYSRTGDREAKDAEDRARRPFDVFVTLKGARSREWHWGRYVSAERAHQDGFETLHATRPNYRPFGRVCTGYRVVDTRTGDVVTDPGLADVLDELADQQVKAA